MQEIEKLAQSVFENAEQDPPKEVWEGIESRLHAAATPKGGHRWLWTLGAGVVVASSLVFGLSGVKAPEPQQLVAMADTMPEIVVVEEQVADEKEPMKEEVKEVTKITCESEKRVETTAIKQTSSVVGSASEEDDDFFDLLEYQLSSHEYDIPSESQPIQGMVQNSNETKQTRVTAKEETKETKQKAALDINIAIPNVLTPNGDGYNDCWVIPDVAKYGKASVQIYTAQRKRVYAADNYMGDFCGDDLPSGDYYYVFAIRERNYTRRGVLVIKR